MKSILVALSIVGLALGGVARADELIYPSALVFAPGYGSSPSDFPLGPNLPQLNDPLRYVGRISTVNDPFTDLLPVGDYEITFLLQGALCQIASDRYGPPPCLAYPWAAFYGGSVSIYLDTSPDAVFTDESTLTDGELVLYMEGLQIILAPADYPDPIQCPWQDPADLFFGFEFTGGSWFERVNDESFYSTFEGEVDAAVPPELPFTFHADGHIDIRKSVPTKPVTWGQMKSLYR